MASLRARIRFHVLYSNRSVRKLLGSATRWSEVVHVHTLHAMAGSAAARGIGDSAEASVVGILLGHIGRKAFALSAKA